MASVWEHPSLALNAYSPPVFKKQKVEFCATMRGPKINLVGFVSADRFLNRIAFPGGSELGVSEQVGFTENTHQTVKNTTISEVNFRSFDLPFSKVFVPGLKLTHHESAAQNIQIMFGRDRHYVHRSRDFRGVPYLSMIVRQHGPEVVHRDRGNPDTEARQVALKESGNKVFSPR